MNQINARLRSVRATRAGLQAQSIADQQATTMQQTTLEELAGLTLDAFWKQESRYVNQMLHQLMGKKRLILLKGEIVGVAEVNGRQSRKSLLPPASGDLVAFGHSRNIDAHHQDAIPG